MAYHLEGLLLASSCVTVYGPSGAGKSSLLQAAVIPALVDKQAIRIVRIDGWPEDRDATTWLADKVYDELALGELPRDVGPSAALISAVQRAARRSSRIVLLYLDQMEQLLYASRSVEASVELLETVNRLIELPVRNLRVVLCLREDYLGPFRDRLRDQRRVLDHSFRVGPFTVGELCEAVTCAAASGEPPQTWAPEAVRPLMLQVQVPGQAESDEAEAQAAYAQIVCRALFQARAEVRGEEKSEIDAERILRTYLEATVDALGPLRADAQRLLEDHLITADGTRTLRTEKELLRILPADELKPVLAALEGAAILHAEEHQGSRYFEIGHDWLARKVFEGRQQRERDEAQQRREQEAAARLARERAKWRAFAAVALVSFIVALVTGVLGLVAVAKSKEAREQKDTAEKAERKAQANEQLAVERGQEARDAGILAGARELRRRGQLAWAIRLLAEVKLPAQRRGWATLASRALAESALRASLRGHDGPLSSAAFSPDGARVLTTSIDGTARIWSPDGKGDPRTIEDTSGVALLAGAWSPDGKRVVTASLDGTARVWSADGAGAPVVLKANEKPVSAVAWAPDGTRVVTASDDGTARVWSADGAGAPVMLRGHQGPIRAVAVSPDGKRIVTASDDGTARIWKADGAGAPAVLKHDGFVSFAAWSPDSKRIVTTSSDKMARVWDALHPGAAVVLEGHESTVLHAAWSSDGKFVATASADKTARIWKANHSRTDTAVLLAGHTDSVVFVAMSPDGKFVATASNDATARLWLAEGGASFPLTGHGAPVRSVTWSPDGQHVLTAAAEERGRSLDNTAKVWATEGIQSRSRAQRGAGVFHSASLSDDGVRVAAAYGDKTARLFRVDGGAAPVSFTGHTDWVASATLSRDGKHVVTASFDRTARVWSADGVGQPVVLGGDKGHKAEVRFAAFSPDPEGKRVVTVSEDRTARVWSADGSGEPVVLGGDKGHEDWLTFAAWSPDGKRIVTTSLDGTARVWSADGRGEPAVLGGDKGHKGGVNAAAWSRDGQRIVTASEDRTARIWSADGSGSPTVLRGHERPVLRAVFGAGDRRVVTSSADGTVGVWLADGTGAPTLLPARSTVIALAVATLDGAEQVVTVTEDNNTHRWLIDVDVLLQRLQKAHEDCLPRDVRVTYLNESKREAREAYERCEREHQRTPLPEGKTQ